MSAPADPTTVAATPAPALAPYDRSEDKWRTISIDSSSGWWGYIKEHASIAFAVVVSIIMIGSLAAVYHSRKKAKEGALFGVYGRVWGSPKTSCYADGSHDPTRPGNRCTV